MKKLRTLHLWIGIICSVFILIESVTGLLLSEPWLVGGTSERGVNRAFNPGDFGNFGRAGQGQRAFTRNRGQAASPGDGSNAVDNGNQGSTGDPGAQATPGTPRTNNGDFQFNRFPARYGGGGVMGWVRQLHEGVVNGTNFRWLVDLTAVGMIALTLTGITMSIQVLRAQRRSRSRRETQQA